MWYRVFAASDGVPDPAGLDACLGVAVRSTVAADEAGWYRIELSAGPAGPIVVERFGADEEGIRAELNAWAGYLETKEASPQHRPLMERVIQARQLVTVERPDDQPEADRLCEALCRHLAGLTRGFYQVDERGFFDADGTLLVAEP